MTFETIFSEIGSSLKKFIEDRWANAPDREIVEPEILSHVENALRSEWLKDREKDRKPIEYWRDKSHQEVTEGGNVVAFNVLWSTTKSHYRRLIRNSLRGRLNAKYDGDDILHELAIRLMPKSDGSWRFDPQRGFRFYTYAAWALHNTTSDFRRGAARRHAYRLDRCHYPLLSDSGVPDDWLEKLSPIVGKRYPTYGCFEGAIRRSLQLAVGDDGRVKELSFDDHRICVIFDTALLPDIIFNDQQEHGLIENDPAMIAESHEWQQRLRTDTANCLRALHANSPLLARIYILLYWEGMSKADTARLLDERADGHENPAALLTNPLKKANRLMRDCLSGKGWGDVVAE